MCERLEYTESKLWTVEMSGTYRIEPLNAQNFDKWQVRMEAILVKNDLWGYVKGTISQPASGDTLTEWLDKDAKAKADIVLSLGDVEINNNITGLRTSREVWLRIESTHRSKDPARKASLLKKVTLTRMKETDDLQVHLTEFFEAESKLREIGLVIPDDVLTILLLYSSPESFHMFRRAIETRDEYPAPEVLRVKILEVRESQKIHENASEQNAMYAKKAPFDPNTRAPDRPRGGSSRGGKTGSYSNSGRNQTVCCRCGRTGHIARKCVV